MTTKPKRTKRPADVVSNAVHVMRVLTGQTQDTPSPDEGKNEAAAALGRKGGAARAKNLTESRRKNIAKNAAKKRWDKKK